MKISGMLSIRNTMLDNLDNPTTYFVGHSEMTPRMQMRTNGCCANFPLRIFLAAGSSPTGSCQIAFAREIKIHLS